MVIQHRSCNTHGISIPEAFARLLPLHFPFVSPTHVLDVPIRETRSACHCLVRRALDLPQRIEHFPDFFSAGRVKERRGYTGGRGKNPALTIRARYIRDILCPLLGVVLFQFIRIRSRVYMLEGMGGRERLTSISHYSFASSRFLIQPSPSLILFRFARSSALSKFADGQRMPPKSVRSLGLESEIFSSYLLTESLRKGGVIERSYYFVQTSSAATARQQTVYVLDGLGIYLRRNFLLP